MSFVEVPPGLTRYEVGKRIVYQSNPPGLRVKIWRKQDFDEFKERGRFANIDRNELDFSIKKINKPDDQMEVDHVEAVDGEVDTMEVDNMVAAGENMYPSSALVPPLPSTPVATNKPENKNKSKVCW